MATTSTSHLTDCTQIDKLARRLDHWRATRQRGQRIPEVFWRRAAKLARSHGISAISRALSLSYYDLQRRLAAATVATDQGRAESAAPHFIQLAAPQLSGEGSTLEILKPCGHRLILRLTQVTAAELVVLMQTFLRP